jgi:hypothetical protein
VIADIHSPSSSEVCKYLGVGLRGAVETIVIVVATVLNGEKADEITHFGDTHGKV